MSPVLEYHCFGILVMSALSFKTNVDSSLKSTDTRCMCLKSYYGNWPGAWAQIAHVCTSARVLWVKLVPTAILKSKSLSAKTIEVVQNHQRIQISFEIRQTHWCCDHFNSRQQSPLFVIVTSVMTYVSSRSTVHHGMSLPSVLAQYPKLVPSVPCTALWNNK